VVAWVLQALWLTALSALTGPVSALASGSTAGLIAVLTFIELIKAALWIVIVAVFVQALLSWVAPDGPLAGVLNALTFPLLTPIRRVLPPLGGVLDLSPLIVIVLGQLLLMLPVAWLEQTVVQIFR
jgi:YggT family protein